jgi:hypothetical protein
MQKNDGGHPMTMSPHPSEAAFDRLSQALDDAVEALPDAACADQPDAQRRQCREVRLLLLQTRERVRRMIAGWH